MNMSPQRFGLSLIALLLGLTSFSQTGTGKLLVLSNVPGHVLVDGKSLGEAEPNKPLLQDVPAGDHLVQLAYTSNGKAEVKNEVITVELDKQRVVNFLVEVVPSTNTTTERSVPIIVADLNVAIPGVLLGSSTTPSELYYAFEAGDEVLLDISMSNVKGTNSLEVATYPGGVVKYSNRAFNDLKGQSFTMAERGILRFVLATNHIADRNAYVKVWRVAVSPSTAKFNTDVLWRMVMDTTYQVQDQRFLVKSDTIIVNPVDQVAKVSSQTASNGNPNHTLVDFTLPAGTAAWSYYIGVGSEGSAAYGVARDKFIADASKPLLALAGTNPLGALAMGSLNYFSKIQGEDNVKYWYITDWESVQLFKAGQSFMQYKQGDVVNDAVRMTTPLVGKVFLMLVNDNIMEPIDVTVKVSAVVANQQWETRSVKTAKVEQKKEAYHTND